VGLQRTGFDLRNSSPDTRERGEKIGATVEAIAPGLDLAVVLKLADQTFFDTHEPLSRSRVLPQIRDAVLVYGFRSEDRVFRSRK
jgi:hypothetical protein